MKYISPNNNISSLLNSSGHVSSGHVSSGYISAPLVPGQLIQSFSSDSLDSSLNEFINNTARLKSFHKAYSSKTIHEHYNEQLDLDQSYDEDTMNYTQQNKDYCKDINNKENKDLQCKFLLNLSLLVNSNDKIELN